MMAGMTVDWTALLERLRELIELLLALLGG